jgi:hypothetical protein
MVIESGSFDVERRFVGVVNGCHSSYCSTKVRIQQTGHSLTGGTSSKTNDLSTEKKSSVFNHLKRNVSSEP